MTREHYDRMLKQLHESILTMGAAVSVAIGRCVEALGQLDAGAAQELIEAEDGITEQRYSIEKQAFLLIATQQPAAGDLRSIVAILAIVSELDRIGDYCAGVAKLTLRMAAESIHPSLHDVRAMAEITQQLLLQALEAFRAQDVEAAARVWERDDEIDELYQQIFRRLILEMVTDKATIRLCTYMLWVAHNFERMGDRVTNLAERVAFVATGEVEGFRHRLRAQTIPE